MEHKINLLEILNHINPSLLDYSEWLSVGHALHHEGYSVSAWDSWSMADRRYKKGECARKWSGFRGSASPITAGTVVQYAKDQGWRPEYNHGRELDWDDIIGSKDDMVIIDKAWVESKEVLEPKNWSPVNDLIKYLEVLFEAGENVGYVSESWEKDGKHLPKQGHWDRTAGSLIEELSQCKGDIGAVVGDHRAEAGAWIRFNPLDGKGCKNENVTEYRYALVESDAMELDQQNAIIRELELPVACLVHSGKKSIHAIVRVDASDYSEYRRRVDYLYSICKKNGLDLDSQNKNPSRLSRMPGATRDGKKQFLIDTNIGKESWAEWYEWVESVNDDLPEPESLEAVWNDLPDLAKPIIDGVLRMGHKMLIAGPSKAGKSFALIELCIAIAEGKKWLDWQCAKGKVLYVNLELDRASCLHRFKDVYHALNLEPKAIKNVDIWNLRGKAVPMDKLAPKLIRRAAKKNYSAIVIDPIYKVITGDENSADQMANFCNQFDKVCTELGCAVIYCHHHSKGSQGGKKSMDRASGSGVFARDPDAMLDFIELEVTDELLKQEENNAACKAILCWLKKHRPDLLEDLSQDDECSSTVLTEHCNKQLSDIDNRLIMTDVGEEIKRARLRTAWRIDGTLREFPKFPPVNMWFDYPAHNLDGSGALQDIQVDADMPGWKRGQSKIQGMNKEVKASKDEEYENAILYANMDGDSPTVAEVADYLGLTEKTVLNRINKHMKNSYYFDKNDKRIKKKEEHAQSLFSD